MKRVAFLSLIAATLVYGCNMVVQEETPELKGIPFFLGQNISCVCTNPNDSTELWVGTETGEVHRFNTETGLFKKFYPAGKSHFDGAIYQIIINGSDTLFAIRDGGLVDTKGMTYEIPLKKRNYSPYSTLFSRDGKTIYSATSNGLYAFEKNGDAHRLDTLGSNNQNTGTDTLRFYSLWQSKHGLYAAAESGLWYKKNTDTMAHVIRTDPCLYIDPIDDQLANILFKDGSCHVLNIDKEGVDTLFDIITFSNSIQTITRIPNDDDTRGIVVGVGLGVLQLKGMDKPIGLPNVVTQSRYPNKKHFAAKAGDYLYVGNSIYLIRIPFYDRDALFKKGASIVSLCLNYNDSTSYFALTEEGRLYSHSLQRVKKEKPKDCGILKDYKPGDQLIGYLKDGLYVKRGGDVFFYGKRFKHTPTSILSSVTCVSPLNKRGLVVGTTDSIFVYSSCQADSIKVPQNLKDICPQLIRVSGPEDTPTVFLHTLHRGAYRLTKDKVEPLDSLREVRDFAFYNGSQSGYVLGKNGLVFLWNFGEKGKKKEEDFSIPIRNIAFIGNQVIGLPEGFNIHGGAIGMNKGNISYIIPDSFVYSMLTLGGSVVFGCDGYISVLGYKGGRGERYVIDSSKATNGWTILYITLILLLFVLLCTVSYLQIKAKTTLKGLETANDELSTKYIELKTTNDELTTKNKMLETGNDELTAKYKELEIANDELTTKNKELETANDELTAKYKELEISNDELTAKNEEFCRLQADEDERMKGGRKKDVWYKVLLAEEEFKTKIKTEVWEKLLESELNELKYPKTKNNGENMKKALGAAIIIYCADEIGLSSKRTNPDSVTPSMERTLDAPRATIIQYLRRLNSWYKKLSNPSESLKKNIGPIKNRWEKEDKTRADILLNNIEKLKIIINNTQFLLATVFGIKTELEYIPMTEPKDKVLARAVEFDDNREALNQ